jgi:hypothetical protein
MARGCSCRESPSRIVTDVAVCWFSVDGKNYLLTELAGDAKRPSPGRPGGRGSLDVKEGENTFDLPLP